ncbi:hypothetical protein [Candidatus Mycoplasma haematohominis]|uniref:Uncharacterized protein n=1 Tax=Candidatus Mycoplasma haematohominis TaxID=1494318 RepID=A0A478FPV7_9MOLU|nr:hypothetical protein [Candidatus Mycoplasma haemohominis]GCE63282.1 hypothetical protein MHSWG343_02690 [Candidatus Mycoplasma haemohominis]
MYIIFRNKAIEKDILAGFLSFLAGLIFFFELLVSISINFSFKALIEQLGKITCQSNLLAFFVAALYCVNPNHRVFRTNFLPLAAATLIWFAGLGFWILLFPIYYIDLGSFLISPENMEQSFVFVFFSIWNHTVTPFFFLIFFYFLNKKKNLWHLIPIKTKNLILVLHLYEILWVSWNIFISLLGDIFPTYGILTNFNPYTKFETDDFSNLFSIRFLIASHLFCWFLSLAIGVIFSSVAIKFRAMNFYDLTGYTTVNTADRVWR